jgi:hypothetical protein
MDDRWARLGVAQRVDRRRLDEAGSRSRELTVRRDEGIRLELCERHEFRVERRLPAELIRDPPCRPLEHLVAEEANLQRVDPGHALHPLGGRDFAAARSVVQRRQRLRPDERRCDELMSGGDLDLSGGDPEQRVAVDDEPGQAGRAQGSRSQYSGRPRIARSYGA